MSGSAPNAHLPPELEGWSWGAFFLTWSWGIGNRVPVALVALVPIAGLIMMFVLGAKGNEWAWEANAWSSVDEFRRVQRKWAVGGVTYVALLLGVVVTISLVA